MNRLLFIIMIFIIPLSSFTIYSLEYDVAIRDNGESILIANVENTSYELKLPKDAKIKGKGVIYTISETETEKIVHLYSSKKGLIAVSTFSLTEKRGQEWTFSYYFPSKARIALSKDAYISSASPNLRISDNIIYSDNIKGEEIKIVYEYPSRLSLAKDHIKIFQAIIIFLLSTSVFLVVYLFLIKPFIERNMLKNNKNKDNLIKILPLNEKKIVKFLLDNNGRAKRSEMEKKGGFSKSSLANSLNLLEKKNIIKIDKSYTTHTIELSEWFRGLK